MYLRTARLCLDCDHAHENAAVSSVRIGSVRLHDAPGSPALNDPSVQVATASSPDVLTAIRRRP